MRAVIGLGLMVMLAGCVSGSLPVPSHMPTAEQAAHWFKLEAEDAHGETLQTHLLVVQPEADGWRFIQTDALGAPVSRQIAAPSGWRNDGFIMPDAKARRLFAAVLPLVDASAYPQMTVDTAAGEKIYLIKQREQWRIRAEDGGYLIRFPDQTAWRVEELQQNDDAEE